MSNQPQASPGWYPSPDRENELRFWDGQNWTEETKAIYPDAPITFYSETATTDDQEPNVDTTATNASEATQSSIPNRPSKNNLSQAERIIVAIVLAVSLLLLIPLSFSLLSSVKETCGEYSCLAAYSENLGSKIDIFGVNREGPINDRGKSLDAGPISWQRIENHPYGKKVTLGANLVVIASILTTLFSIIYLWQAVRIARNNQRENKNRIFWLVIMFFILTVTSLTAVFIADDRGPRYAAVGAAFETQEMSESEKETKRNLLNQERKQIDNVINKIISLHTPGQRLLVSPSPAAQTILQCSGISNGTCRELLTLWKEEGVEIIAREQDNYCPQGHSDQCANFEIFIRNPKSDQICVRGFTVYPAPVFSDKTILKGGEECLAGTGASYEEMELTPPLHMAEQKPLDSQ